MNDLIQTAKTTRALATSPALAERVAEWLTDAKEGYRPNSWRALRADWESFSAWCALRDVPAVPASPKHVAEYLEAEYAGRWRELPLKPGEMGPGKPEPPKALATIRHRIATIRLVHTKAAGLRDPCKSEKVRLKVKAILSKLGPRGKEQRQAVALTRVDLTPDEHTPDAVKGFIERMRAGTGNPKELRDWALALTARSTLARASELVRVRREDIVFDDDDGDGTVLLERVKTGEMQECYLGREATAAVKRWLAIAGIEAGSVFIGLTKSGKVTGRALNGEPARPRPLNVREVGRILKAFGERIGKAGLSGHSGRVGMCQDLVRAGKSVAEIMNAGNWRRPGQVARYSRRITAKGNAVASYLKDKLR